jgi:hypothetical protein
VPGDPKECREHARNCLALAEQASTSNGRETLLNLANQWTTLAAELESADAFLNAMKAIEPEASLDGKSAPSLNGGAARPSPE